MIQFQKRLGLTFLKAAKWLRDCFTICMSVITQNVFQAAGLAALVDDEPDFVASSKTIKSPWELYQEGWRPKFNPTQLLARNSKAKFKLYHSERATGKTHGALHEMVEHCFLNANALGMLLVRESQMATEGGAWHKLNQEVLPVWKYGNATYDGKQLDNGINLEYSEPRQDPQTKKPYIWLRNRFGSGSLIILISLPLSGKIRTKVKGREPSFVVADEAQTFENDDYFTSLVQQIGRRKGITTDQKIIYCANPEGPSHWLYQMFMVKPINVVTGQWDQRFAEFHFPIKENLHNLPPSYWEDNVVLATKNDPIERARMVEGQWIERPAGLALFENFSPTIHVRGDAISGRGILPVKGHTVITGWDLGSGHSSVHFLQIVPTKEKNMILVFDEVNAVGKWCPYFKYVPMVVNRMSYWEERIGTTFSYMHISDSSAFNQYRAADGTYDVLKVEEESASYSIKRGLPSRFTIKMRECPKPPNSKAARVMLLRDAFDKEDILISATCVKTIQAVSLCGSDQENGLIPDKRSPYRHAIDSLTYPLFFFSGTGRIMRTIETGSVESPIFVAGRGQYAA